MSSFISSFKSLLLAALMIAAIEAAVAAIIHPNFAVRSNYLSWTFAQPELGSDLLTYQKLDRIPLADADIVQVGDSSGLHGVRPHIVDRYLGGLRFVNLSCCAALGYDGYYAIAKAALGQMRHPKAVVMYLSLNNLPWDRLLQGLTRAPEAFNSLGTIFDPPSQSLRPEITSFAYSMDGVVASRQDELAVLNSGYYAQIVRTDGWMPAPDQTMDGDNRLKYFHNYLCASNPPENIPPGPPMPLEVYGIRMEVFEKMAELARRHGAKLIVIFNPHPCSVWNALVAGSLHASLSELNEKYRNVAFYPKEIFKHWPDYMFLGADHLRVGYERPNSIRIGRFLADALGVSVQEASPLPEDEAKPPALIDLSTPPVWSGGQEANSWEPEGAIVQPRPAAEGTRVTETADSGRHNVKLLATGLTAGPYIVSLRFKPIGDRFVTLGARVTARGSTSTTFCNPKVQTAVRQNFYDGDMSFLDDGWILCWGSIEVPGSAVAITIGTQLQTDTPNPGSAYFTGSPEHGLIIRDIRLHRGWRPATPETGPPGGETKTN